MNVEIPEKLAVFAAALAMNALIITGVEYIVQRPGRIAHRWDRFVRPTAALRMHATGR